MRTDLTSEFRSTIKSKSISGIKETTLNIDGLCVSEIEIQNKQGSMLLKKPIGRYVTVIFDGYPQADMLSSVMINYFQSLFDELLPNEGEILIAGLGNADITPDAIGPLTIKKIIATRHIDEKTKSLMELPNLRCISAISPGVSAQSGIDTHEYISSICKQICPVGVILIDALTCGKINRIGKSIQISDVGLVPGSGIGNKRKAINQNTLGVPVIAIGVPTVADFRTSVEEFGKVCLAEGVMSENDSNHFVTSKDIDMIVSLYSRFVALMLNCVFQKNLLKDEVLSVMMQ